MANVKGMTIDIGANTSAFQKALSQLNAPINKLSKSLKEVNQGLKFDAKNPTLIANKMSLLSDKIAASKDKIKELNLAINELNTLQLKNGSLTDSQKEKMIKLTTELEKERISLSKMETDFANIGKSGEKSFAIISDKANEVGKRMTDLGIRLSRVSVAVSGLFGIVVKEAIDFETAITGVYKTVDGTEEQLANLEKGIRDLAKTIPASTTEIAAVAEAAGQLGIATDDILDFSRVMIDLGNSTNLSAEEAATALAKFANVTKMNSKDYSRLGSVVVALGNNFATTEADIVSMASGLAATGELTGLTEAQIMAMATAMSSVGIEAEAGGSAMSKLLKKIQVATETGSKDLSKFAQVSGMSAKDFQKAFQEDSVKALTSFIKGLNDTKRNGKSAIAILEDMDLKEVRLSNTILSLANASDVMSNAVELSNKAWNENTALQEEATKRYQTLASKIQVATNRLKEIGIRLGTKLMPIIERGLDKLDELANSFDKLSDKQVTTILKVGALVVALGPLLKVFGSVVTAGGGFVKILQTIVNAAGVATGSIVGTSSSVIKLASVFSALASPIGIITTVLGALVIGMTAHEIAVNKEIKSMGGLREEIDEQRTAWDELVEQRNKSLDLNYTEITNAEQLAKELRTITDENGKVKAGYETRAQVILNTLNKALGTEYTMTDNIINKYGELRESIDKVIATKKAEILLNSYEKEYATAIKGQSDATKTLIDLREQLKEKTEQYASANGRTRAQLEKEIRTLGQGIKEQTQLISEYGETITDYENLQKSSINGSAEEVEKACNDMINSYKEVQKASKISIEAQIIDQKKYVDNLENALKDAKKNNDTYQANILQTQINSSKEQLKTLEESLVTQTSAIRDLTPEQVNAYKDMAKNSMNEYNNVLNKMPEETRKRIESATGVISKTTELQNAAGNLGGNTLNNFSDAFQLRQEMDRKFQEASNEINANRSIDGAMSNVIGRANSVVTNFDSSAWGRDLVDGMGRGIQAQSNSRSFTNILSGFAGKIASYLHFSRPDVGPLRNYEKWMPDMVQGLAKSLQQSQPILINQVRAMSAEMSNALQTGIDMQSIDSKINKTGARVNNVAITVNPQNLNEASLNQAFNYINNRFGMAL